MRWWRGSTSRPIVRRGCCACRARGSRTGAHDRSRLEVAHELVAELHLMRAWLELEAVEVIPKGDLARDVAVALRSPGGGSAPGE